MISGSFRIDKKPWPRDVGEDAITEYYDDPDMRTTFHKVAYSSNTGYIIHASARDTDKEYPVDMIQVVIGTEYGEVISDSNVSISGPNDAVGMSTARKLGYTIQFIADSIGITLSKVYASTRTCEI